MNSENKVLVIIPTYNEEDNIDFLIPAIFSYCPEVHLLFVDDGSQDGTMAKIKYQAGLNPGKINIINRGSKMGLGSAYVEGFTWAMEQNYDQVIQMDADLSHEPEILPELIAHTREYDLAIGSRNIPGGGSAGWSQLRKFISILGSFYARTILGLKIADLTGGYNAWKTSLLAKLDLSTIRSNGYCFQIEMKYRASRLNANIIEIPIIFRERREGKSKMTTGIILEALVKVWKLRAWKK